MPTDPRAAIGACSNSNPWAPPLHAWQTGGAGAGNMPASVLENLAWPPASINLAGPISSLPSYTPTGTIITLPGPTFTTSGGSRATATINVGNGWANTADNQGLFVPIPTCTYLDPWVDPGTAPPSPLCPAAARREAAPEHSTTPAPAP